jgi:hypothetical protein
MKILRFYLIAFAVLLQAFDQAEAQCFNIPGTIQLSDTVGIKATEITVADYASFIVANGYDSSYFPLPGFIEEAPYKELFADLQNKKHARFLKAKGSGPYTLYVKSIKGSKAEKEKINKWLDMPVGGISRSQAEYYCNWLEKYYNAFPEKRSAACFYEIRIASDVELETAIKMKGMNIDPGINGQSTFRFIAIIHKR